MEQAKLRRISELSRKSRAGQSLTEAERAEQAALRKEYIDKMKQSLRCQLDAIEIIDETGAHPLAKKQ